MKESDSPGGLSPEEPEPQDPANIPPPLENPENYVYVVPWGKWVPRGVPDLELFDQNPEEWYRKNRPDWDEERIKLEVERMEVATLVFEIQDREQALEGRAPSATERGEIEALRQRMRERREAFQLKFLDYLSRKSSE